MHALGHEVFLGEGTLTEISRIVAESTVDRLTLVIDQPACDASGAAKVLDDALRSSQVTRVAGFAPNPRIEDIVEAIRLFRASDSQLVIAFGGGTAIDIGKIVAAVAGEGESIRDIITGKAPLTQSGVPLVAIPTTAGTGSEATSFAVAYVDGEKFSLDAPCLLPDHAIVDPQLTYSLPAKITAATGLDAFCQAIESIWAVGATDESIGYAAEAAKLAFDNLTTAVNAPTPIVRRAMCQASHLAGKAINISRTTASHALSYPLTSRWNIPHGIAVALTISPMLGYNAKVSEHDCVDSRGSADVLKRISMIVDLLGAGDVGDAQQRIQQFVFRLGCPNTLAEAGVTAHCDLVELISKVNAQRMSNNPRRTTQESLIELLTTP